MVIHSTELTEGRSVRYHKYEEPCYTINGEAKEICDKNPIAENASRTEAKCVCSTV